MIHLLDLITPQRPQPRDVGRCDLRQRRVALAAIGSRIGKPVLRFFVRIHDARVRYLSGKNHSQEGGRREEPHCSPRKEDR